MNNLRTDKLENCTENLTNLLLKDSQADESNSRINLGKSKMKELRVELTQDRI